ncbi:type VI secretion system-associated protein VasI [Enterovibrio baiacu]|uniref:type VI secretion system-associated protein VasI n=1 Tax=Enterovibrio baiacu TaxID=2491023 RepID=UPI001F0CCC83|nr:type VI secretion system-associated protein VasI [Enterovibrio baiacu]
MKRGGSLNVGLLIGTTMLGWAGLSSAWANTAPENAEARSNASLVKQAQTCSAIPTRLERLACFDGVFNTPVDADNEQTIANIKPEAYQRAHASEAARSEGEQGFVVRYTDPEDHSKGIWMTATAIPDRGQQREDMPILMLSCIDSISRMELVLPTTTSAGKATVLVSGSFAVTDRWLSDDSGTIMHAGRGIPAINVMKALMSSSGSVLRSELDEIGNLTFDTEGLTSSIRPMRNTCRW